MKITKKKILFAISAVILPLQAFSGALSGFLIARLLAGRNTGQVGRIKSFVLSVGRWKVHFHHWMYGVGVALSAIFFGLNLPFPQFSFGLLAGLVFQGFWNFSD